MGYWCNLFFFSLYIIIGVKNKNIKTLEVYEMANKFGFKGNVVEMGLRMKAVSKMGIL